MERGSDKHGPRIDDQLESEVQGVLRGGKPTRVREELEPEPTVTDDGEPATNPGAVDPDRERGE
ncbi:hypothetical protein ACFPZ0_25195 [Streptomonospora nanhaiensis]|uniref:Uncharacterized protein n=1 Tax=Streptomonospora nanhaiensis TaxID=1323731 RepID=A0A853BNV8_9ACTN|nr:hypothetical protein [Streptomonospora nanhaiensis]MBV2365102.1 hypothetical protein [Streptomonospora nanhaiensis]MBX9391846.1 hypothetical protein [Streptomonospora nanhaiensis]NYI96690.1 hypothetical protein [Streptomonospora nanhaiensis]